MPPLVVDIMTANKQALLRREQQQMQAMAQQWRRVEAALQDQVELFARRVAEDGLTIGQIQSRQFQLDRFQSLLRQVRAELDKYTDYVEPMISNRQQEMAQTGIDHAAAAINAVGEQYGVTIRFDQLPIGAVESMVGLSGAGSPLRDLLVGSYGAGADAMLNQLVTGVALGRNPRVIARMMVRQGLSQSLNRMLVIARTEQLRVYRESSRQTYIHSGVVERYKRLATKDRRTCPACLFADGQIYELGETMAEHPAGRCTMVPVVTGFPPVTWQSGQDWFRAQPADTQRSILGPGRFAAWQRGAFDLDALVTVRTNATWGDSLQPTPLRELISGN